MTETLQMIFAFVAVLTLLIGARKFRISKMIKIRDFILDDLKSQKALNPKSAVDLPYAHKSILKMGLRDDRPRVLRQLVQFEIIGVTEDSCFYIKESSN